MRVVLDTNILISAFVFPGGAPEAVYRLAIERQVDLVTSPSLLSEFGGVLAEKFGWQPAMAGAAVAQVTRIAIVVRPSRTIHVVADDPTDDRVLEAALEGSAEIIVSGNRHLLRLRRWEGVRIVGAADLLEEMGATPDEG